MLRCQTGHDLRKDALVAPSLPTTLERLMQAVLRRRATCASVSQKRSDMLTACRSNHELPKKQESMGPDHTRLPDLYLTSLWSQRDVNAPTFAANARFTDLFDPRLNASCPVQQDFQLAA